MNKSTSLTNHLLIAMPGLDDANFHHTVTYICEHDEKGAMGIVINRPSSLNLNDILGQLDIDNENTAFGEQTIYAGGPVQMERGFVLHTTGQVWASTLQITPTTSITTSASSSYASRSITPGTTDTPSSTVLAFSEIARSIYDELAGRDDEAPRQELDRLIKRYFSADIVI